MEKEKSLLEKVKEFFYKNPEKLATAETVGKKVGESNINSVRTAISRFKKSISNGGSVSYAWKYDKDTGKRVRWYLYAPDEAKSIIFKEKVEKYRKKRRENYKKSYNKAYYRKWS